MTLNMDGKAVFVADWGGGIAKAPMSRFAFKGGKEVRRLKGSWVDNKGADRHHHGDRFNEDAIRDHCCFRPRGPWQCWRCPTRKVGAAAPVASAPDAGVHEILTDKIPSEAGGGISATVPLDERGLHQAMGRESSIPAYEFSLEADREMFSKAVHNGKAAIRTAFH